MFLHVSVILFTGEGGVCLWVQGVVHNPLDTSPCITPGHTPLAHAPPGHIVPLPWSTSGWYASYWNAFLLTEIFSTLTRYSCFFQHYLYYELSYRQEELPFLCHSMPNISLSLSPLRAFCLLLLFEPMKRDLPDK